MADTLPNIQLLPNVWVDLYAASGILVGNQIIVQNIGNADVYLTAQFKKPLDDESHQIITRGQFAINDLGDNGAWAFSFAGGAVNVRMP